MGDSDPEAEAVLRRYAQRAGDGRYVAQLPEVYLAMQERQRAMLRLWRGELGLEDLGTVKLVEVGCGTGANLLEFLRLGFQPKNLTGIELLPERVARAREVLPAALAVHEGDATRAVVAPQSTDVVFQSLVFSSLLDDDFQAELARKMWSWIRPGGGVLWYDFIYDNPANADVRGVPVRRVRQLFPEAHAVIRRITLAPPISRRICRVHPLAYGIFNSIPFLRTHVLCWLTKTRQGTA